MHTLIIGGTKGIGKALVKTLARDGHIISVISRSSDSKLPNVSYWSVDVSNQDLLTNVLSEIIEKNGKLNNLVFFQRFRGEGDSWEGEIDVSLTATKNIIDNLADKFDSDGGSIVIISSSTGHFIAQELPPSYHIGKAALNQIARYYAVKLGPKGIRVNCVSPSAVLKEETKEFYQKNKELHDLYKEITPLGRMPTSDDVANVIAFLCSSKASIITGQNITVDGGVSLHEHQSLARKLTSLGTNKLKKNKKEK